MVSQRNCVGMFHHAPTGGLKVAGLKEASYSVRRLR